MRLSFFRSRNVQPGPLVATSAADAPGSLVHSAGLLVGVRVAGVAAQLLVLGYLANRLNLSQMAVFALGYSGLGLIRVLGSLGMDHASVRLLAVGSGNPIAGANKGHAARRLASAGLFLAFASGLVWAAAAGLLLGTSAGLHGLSAGATGALVAAIPAHAIMGLLVGQLRGLGQNLAAQWPEALGLHLLSLLLVLIWGANLALPAVAVASWGMVAVQLGLRRRALRPLMRSDGPLIAPGSRFGRAECAALLGCGWPILQAQAFVALATRAPLFLAALVTGPASVAVLEVALRFGMLPSLLTGSIGATYSPAIARQSARGDTCGLRQSRRAMAWLAGAPAGIYLLLCPILAGPLLGWLLPPAYLGALFPMTLIALGVFFNALCSGASYQLLMSGRAALVRRHAGLRLAVLVAGALILGPAWGAAGIALSVAAGYAVADLGMALAVHRDTA